MNKKAIILKTKENPFTALETELSSRGVAVTTYFKEDVRGYEKLSLAAKKVEDAEVLVIIGTLDKAIAKKSIDELTEEEYNIFKYDSMTYFFDINRTIIENMCKNGGGKVLLVTPISAEIPFAGETLGGACGAALEMGIKCLCEESTEDKIYANTVAIGALKENDELYTVSTGGEMLAHIPGKNLIDVKDAAKKCADVLLMTDVNFTGNMIKVDSAFSCAYMREW